MSKIIFKFLFIFFLSMFLNHKVFALGDGIYTGLYKMIYAHSKTESKKGDQGVFEFTIKNNKVVKFFAYDYPNFNSYRIKTKFVINSETNELTGYATGYGSNVRFKINMKGIFIGKKFAGEGNTVLTSPHSLVLEKFIFESID